MTGFLSNRLTQIKSKAVNKASSPETAAKLKVKSGKDITQGAAANLFNISVTSFNKTQGAGGQAGAYSPTLINNPLVDRITPTTSTQLLSFYQQHHQLLKNQEKLSSQLDQSHAPLLVSAPSIKQISLEDHQNHLQD